jgi:hypothetical protein
MVGPLVFTAAAIYFTISFIVKCFYLTGPHCQYLDVCQDMKHT